MSTIKFYTHSLASKGHKELKKELIERGHSVLSLKKEGSRYRYRSGHFVINWGFARDWSMGVEPPASHFLNGNTDAIIKVSNKKSFFQRMPSHVVPSFATSLEEASALFEETDKVYCRTQVSSSQGRGIVVARNVDELVSAPLYTAGLSCRREFRVHVFFGEVADFVMKKRMSSERREQDGITLNEDVRNHDNGYVFARQDVELPDSVRQVSLEAMAASHLNFGAVDVVLDDYGNAKVLEINTAPGLTGTTVIKYADAVERWISNA